MNISIYIILLLINTLFFDLFNYAKIQNYNPIGWNLDYLRHHATSNNILQHLQIKGIYDTSLSDGPFLYAWPLPNSIYAGHIYIFGHTLGFLLSLITFSVASYITLYMFLRLLFDKELSKFTAFIGLCVSNGIIYYFFYGANILDQVSILHRVVNPLFSFPILFLFMWSLLKTIKTSKFLYAIISGFLFGSLFISYIYFAVFAAFFSALIIFQEIFLRSEKKGKIILLQNKLRFPLIFFIFAALPGVIIFAINYVQLDNLGQIIIDWKQRAGILETRSFIIESSDWIHFLLVIPAFLISILSYLTSNSSQKKQSTILIFLTYFSAWLASHSNVLTGVSPQKSNFTAYLNFPFFTILISASFFNFMSFVRSKNYKYARIFLLIAILVTLFNINYISAYSNKLQSQEIVLRNSSLSVSDDEMKLFKWLDSDAFKGTKILAKPYLSTRIAAFSEIDTYFIDYLSKVTNSTLEKRQRVIESIFLKSNPELKLSLNSLLDEMYTSNVTHIISSENIDPLLPCIDEKTFGKIKVCKLNYS